MAYPRIRSVTSGLVLLVGALFATPALAQDTNAPTDINRVFVFGDSLSDGGAGITLVNLACKFATLNDPMCGVTRDSVSLGAPFHEGRSFSDGPVAMEVAANLLGKPMRPAYRINWLITQEGENYAIAGARASPDSGSQALTSLAKQVDAWVAHRRGIPSDSKDLHVIFIGGNDVLAAIEQDNLALVTNATMQIQAAIDRLAAHGARRFLVYSLPNFQGHRDAVVPRYYDVGGKPGAKVRRAGEKFNHGIAFLKAPKDTTIYRFDTQAFFQFAKSVFFTRKQDARNVACLDPTDQAFASLPNRPGKDVTISGTYRPGCDAGQLAHRMWFDDIHPSGALHQMLGIASYDFIVEQLTGKCAVVAWGKDAAVGKRQGLPGTIYRADGAYFRSMKLDDARDYSHTSMASGFRIDLPHWQRLGHQLPKTCGTHFRKARQPNRITNMHLWEAYSATGEGGYAKGEFDRPWPYGQFVYYNPQLLKFEYFKLRQSWGNYGAFPTDGRSNNAWWERITID